MINSHLIQRVINLAVQVQQIPAPTFEEMRRAEFMQASFEREGLADVEISQIGNVYGRLPGKGQAPPIIVSAHLDTVFPENTNLKVRRDPERVSGPGIGDNSIGLAGLLAVLWYLQDRKVELASDLWLVANVGEEGLGDLRGMQEITRRFSGDIRAYIIVEGMALGQVYHQGLAVKRYRIRVTTAGGHSWVDYGKPSAIHELTTILSKLLDVPVSESPRSTFNIGVISGGTTINTIAAEANIELDLRSEDLQSLEELENSVLGVLGNYQNPGVQVGAEMIGHRPAGKLARTHPLVLLAASCLEQVGIEPRFNIGSTDANIPLSLGYPAVCLGLTTGNGAHTLGEYIDISPLQLGLEQLILVIEGLDRS